MTKLVSQADFARSSGVSRQYVSKLVKNGTIKLKSGKVDPDAARMAMAAIREPARVSKTDTPQPANVSSMSLEELMELRSRLVQPTRSDNDAAAQLLDARLANERSKARLNELKVLEEEGRLVDAEQVSLDFASAATMLRQKLRSIPDRVAQQAHACTSAAEVRRLLAKEIDIALTALADGFAQDDDED